MLIGWHMDYKQQILILILFMKIPHQSNHHKNALFSSSKLTAYTVLCCKVHIILMCVCVSANAYLVKIENKQPTGCDAQLESGRFLIFMGECQGEFFRGCPGLCWDGGFFGKR